VRLSRPASPASITLTANRLSVDARDSDLRTVIARIATQAKIEVHHLDGLPDTRVSVRFADLSVAAGLKRLFRAAELAGYALITETVGESIHVRRILLLPAVEGSTGRRAMASPGRRPPVESDSGETAASGDEGSVFEELTTNTTARRLLSQLIHPNEQVRERALESLLQVVGEEQKQAQLLEFVEPLMDDMASEDKTAREDARAEIRKLLSR
jgi:hypothetical protein